MAAFLSNLRNVVITGFVLAAIVFGIHVWKEPTPLDSVFWMFFVRWLHIISGVMWIGLLWYFNFVATPTTPKIPGRASSGARQVHHAGGAILVPLGSDEHDLLRHHPRVHERLSGAGLHARLRGYEWRSVEHDLPHDRHRHVVRDDQVGQRLVRDLAEPASVRSTSTTSFPISQKRRRPPSAKTAGMFSRINTMLSIPMLFCMAAATRIGPDRPLAFDEGAVRSDPGGSFVPEP